MARILTELTADYLDTVAPPVDELLEEMEAQADEEGIPIAAREVSRLQAMLARLADADRVLEFGTAIGYSTIQVARTGTDVVTIERDPERIADAEAYIERAGVGDRITIVENDALPALDEIDGPFDLIFLDAAKHEYPEYLDRTLPMLREGGIVLVDNMLWSGAVPEAEATGEYADEDTEVLHEFNADFVEHDQLDAIVTPLADGTGIGMKTE